MTGEHQRAVARREQRSADGTSRPSTARWDAVGAAITARMADLGLTQTDLAQRADTSRERVRSLMRGTPAVYRPTTLARIASVLGWTPDAIARLLAGDIGESESMSSEDADEQWVAETVQKLRTLTLTERRRFDDLLDRMLRLASRGAATPS